MRVEREWSKSGNETRTAMSESTREHPTEGWVYPTRSARKLHYVRNQRSLCGQYGYFDTNLQADNGEWQSDDCQACSVKLRGSEEGKQDE